MSRPVVLRPEATRDLDDARAWYEQARPGFGAVFAARAAAIDGLGQHPELYGLVWQNVRAAPIRRHPHVIYYRVHPDRVDVLAVLHGSRDPAVWQGRA